jgi:hypothetical protein
MENNCKKCVYAGAVNQCDSELLICTNKPGREGELFITRQGRICNNYFAKRQPALRLEPTQPENDEIRFIALTKGKFAIVDKEDFEQMRKFKWFASGPEKYPYGVRAIYPGEGRKITLYMHREIMKAPRGLVVDHINGNTLDNRRVNLRLATKRQNTCNMRVNKEGCSSKYRGVCRHKATRKWAAKISVDMKRIHLGVFEDEVEAARAYDTAAKKYHGEFARLNFPNERGEKESSTCPPR